MTKLEDEKSSKLSLMVTPRASRDKLTGIIGDELKIQLAAPPVDGAANDRLLKFLAKLLGIRTASLSLVSGSTSRHKVVSINGLNLEEVWNRLNTHLPNLQSTDQKNN